MASQGVHQTTGLCNTEVVLGAKHRQWTVILHCLNRKFYLSQIAQVVT